MAQKTALVTGSSRGIGRAVALRLAKDGYEVIVHCAGNVEKAESAKKEIEAAGGKARVVQANLCDVEETKALLHKIGNIDVLVLNASLQYRTKWQEITLDACYEQLNCNFVSSFLLIQGVVAHMKEQHWGRIVTVGSVQEAKPHPDMLIYSSSKMAQTGMMRSLALQLAGDGITVNNVAPGVIYTDRNKEALGNPDYAEQVMHSIPVGRWGTPEDCAAMIAFLVSDEGNYITGQNIFVDGGKSVQ